MSPLAPTRYFGKYRGTVTDNVDPLVLGRLLCLVPAVPAGALNWALPCVPFAGLEQGLVPIPTIGANVWVEFEGGDPDHPIWSGCFWEELELPIVPELAPQDPALVKVLRTAFCTLIFNDTPEGGGITISVTDAAVPVPVTMTMTSVGMEINVGDTNLLMNPETGFTLTAGETEATVTPELVSINAPAVEITADTITITGETNIVGITTVEGDEVSITGPTTVTPEATIAGDLNVEGACEVGGETNLLGALSVEGETNMLGAATVEGEANFLGAVTVEGDVAAVGAVEIAGTAVAALFMGPILPPPFP